MQGRRAFLKSGIELSGALLLGCSGEDPLKPPRLAAGASAELQPHPESAGQVAACDAELSNGTFLELERFVGEDVLFETRVGAGLDGRLYTDLSKVNQAELLTPTESFYIRTHVPDQIDLEAPWLVTLDGAVTEEVHVPVFELLAEARSRGTHVLECSGNSRGGGFGLLSSAEWEGVPLLSFLDRVEVSGSGVAVLVEGFDGHSQPSVNNHSTPGASWVFSLGDIAASGAFLATGMNGAPLTADHGAPLRLMVPGWYGCTCIKWVNRVSVVGTDEPSTTQMREFARRTHQVGTPQLASEFTPANLHVAAMPTRVERWLVGSRVLHRVVGIVWGGAAPVHDFEIRVGEEPWHPVSVCSGSEGVGGFRLWSYIFQPQALGAQPIVLRATESSVPQRRLDTGFYLREVEFRA